MWTALKQAGSIGTEPTAFRVLRLVRDSSLISRTEIAQRCKLSKPTVSDIVNRFLEAGVIRPRGEAPSSARGGRRRELLEFNPQAGHVIGIDIRMNEAVVAAIDLSANILERESLPHRTGAAPEQVLNNLTHTINRFFESGLLSRERTAGIGIGLPGLIDRASGVVRVADTLAGWEGARLRDLFEARFGIPVSLENDVKTRTLAEVLFGRGRTIRDQVFLWIGEGIGAGIILDGRLHHGITGSAGEVGYNTIVSPGEFPLLYAGQRDFGEILSDASIVRAYARYASNADVLSIRELCHESASGNSLAVRLLEEVAHLASIVCINLINTLNPEVIIIGGSIAAEGRFVIDRIQQRVREDILSVPAHAARIVPASFHEDGVILGAAGLVLHDLFMPAGARTTVW
jgi:predicted NBD/HSP70 family sugar kinase